MKSLPNSCLLPSLALACLILLPSCAKPLKPHELYYPVGHKGVGGPMRVQKEQPIARNPPRLPKIVLIDPTISNATNSTSTEVPPPQPLDVSIKTTAQSPVPTEADAYFQQPPPPQNTALGALFQAIFQPPPTPPPVNSSASFQVVP